MDIPETQQVLELSQTAPMALILFVAIYIVYWVMHKYYPSVVESENKRLKTLLDITHQVHELREDLKKETRYNKEQLSILIQKIESFEKEITYCAKKHHV